MWDFGKEISNTNEAERWIGCVGLRTWSHVVDKELVFSTTKKEIKRLVTVNEHTDDFFIFWLFNQNLRNKSVHFF
jgi:hypothetical protein